ncbi:MAG: MHS family MFS transporter [Nocardiopsaceae bacterium]|nr:MHS family MFS transporter [Nocardiopsaceae bacterium]
MATSSAQPTGQSGRLGADLSAMPRRAFRRLLAAGLIGSSIEWYDFFLYGTAAALVFPRVFFPYASPLMGTLLAFSTFWAGFAARPIGGMLAGHLGDKYGRKPVVVTCLAVAGASTFLIGCLPTAAAVGGLAPTLLVLLRFAQGIATGGQWGGIILLLTESAGPKRRGFAGTFGQTSVPVAVIISNLIFVAVSALMPNHPFFSWGWRIPFWFSAVIFSVVVYIQAKVEDTPEFRELQRKAEQSRGAVARAPLAQVIRSKWGTILLGCGILSATNSLFYVSISGLLSYETDTLKVPRNPLLAIVLIASVAMLFVIPWSGHVSDRIGRRPLILIGGAGVAAWAFPYFLLAGTASLAGIFVAITVGFVFQCLTYGPIASFLGELFAPNVRYSGASLAYQLSAVIVSGGTPFLMTYLIAQTGSTMPVAAFILAMGLVTFATAWFLPETNTAEVRRDPHAVPGTQLYPRDPEKAPA